MPVPTVADPILTRADLLGRGLSGRGITALVRSGRLIRVRRDRYLEVDAPAMARATRVGGRLACVSLLALIGIFVENPSALHVHLDHARSRLRHPDHRQVPWSAAVQRRTGVRLHWSRLCTDDASVGTVSVVDAVLQAIRCQEARMAVATVDSALRLGVLDRAEVVELRAWLPRRLHVVLELADGTAHSGPETLMRLLLRQLGLKFEAQVWIERVGWVDFVVEGWLIVECDSKAHHEGWQKQRNDRKRDLYAAAQGYATFRPLAEDIMFDRAAVLAALRGLMGLRTTKA